MAPSGATTPSVASGSLPRMSDHEEGARPASRLPDGHAASSDLDSAGCARTSAVRPMSRPRETTNAPARCMAG
jgi:hypothetical protein